MNEELRVLLADSETQGELPLAARLLGDAIQQLVDRLPSEDRAQDGSLPQPVLQQFPLAGSAMRLLDLGLVPSRVQLRELAELEHYVEELVRTAPERQARRTLIASITGRSPALLGEENSSSSPAGRDLMRMRYGFAMSTIMLAFIGVASFPTAVSWGEVTWAMAGISLALAVLFAYCWHKIRI